MSKLFSLESNLIKNWSELAYKSKTESVCKYNQVQSALRLKKASL